MKTLTLKQFLNETDYFVSEMKKGRIFIYPTDTIYGVGCDATNHKAVNKIRRIKLRDSKPFSVIAPTKSWIKETCNTSSKINSWIKKLPGPYTLILELKHSKAISDSVNNNSGSIGIRIPDSPFSKMVRKFRKPFVTTSVNLSGKKPNSNPNEIPLSISKNIDYLIDSGPLPGTPSTIVVLTDNQEKIIKRNSS
jgi:L-threonylcarbamoyladenylate synthase